MLIGARWPNINKHWDEYDESDGDNSTPGSYWDLGTRSYTDRTTEVNIGANQFRNNETSHGAYLIWKLAWKVVLLLLMV